MKLVNLGLQPAFNAGLRSLFAALVLAAWMRMQGRSVAVARETIPSGLLAGVLFAAEFLLLFIAIDLTTVARVSVMFYTMPVWLAVMAHLLVPGDRLNLRKLVGLALAMGGVAWAILDRQPGGGGSLAGDLMALTAALGWAGIAIIARTTPFARIDPEMQLMWQVTVSAVLLLFAAPFFGPLFREFVPWHLAGFAFQVGVVSIGFVGWFVLLKIYPASGVASFAFLAPVFGVVFGWLILGETVRWPLWASLALVAVGLTLINRPSRAAMSAQTGK
ncbi:DMT family transporter [Pseudoruegeria sp. HB172150]|uniref:DMT family transporter n=1 Tax=Pseudoruegeria sp. HB172150 TaxID=2721164 RepID=UPI00352D2C0B